MVRAAAMAAVFDDAKKFQTELRFHDDSPDDAGYVGGGNNRATGGLQSTIAPSWSCYNTTARRRDTTLWLVLSRADLAERGDASNALSDDELMNIVGAFVGGYAFEIIHVAHDRVIVDDAVGAENVAGFACGLKSDGDVVHFKHGDVRRIDLAIIFQPADVQREKLALHNLGNHPSEFFLDQLMTGDGLVGKLLAGLRVLQRGIITGHGRSKCPQPIP